MVGSGPPAVPLISMLSTRTVPANQRELLENIFYLYAFFNKDHMLKPQLTCKSVSNQRYSTSYLSWYRKCPASKRQKYLYNAIYKWYFWEVRWETDSNTWWVSSSISCILLTAWICSPPCPSLLTGVITEFYPEQKKSL